MTDLRFQCPSINALCSLLVLGTRYRLDEKEANQNCNGQVGSPVGNTQSSGKRAQPTGDMQTSRRTIRAMRAFGQLRNPFPTQRVELPVACKSKRVSRSFKSQFQFHSQWSRDAAHMAWSALGSTSTILFHLRRTLMASTIDEHALWSNDLPSSMPLWCL